MSSGNPFYHFAACNMCSFPVSHSTNILVSLPSASRSNYALSSCALRRSLPLSSHEPSPCVCTCLQEGQWSQSHKSSDTYVFPPSAPTHTESSQRARLCGTASHPPSSQHQRCQRCGHRKYILLRNLFVTAASPRPGCKQVLYFWSPLTVALSVNLSDHVWFAACVLA